MTKVARGLIPATDGWLMSHTGEQLRAAALVAVKIFAAGLWALLVIFLVPVGTLGKVLLVALVPVVWLSWLLFKRWRGRRAAASPSHENGARRGRPAAPAGSYEELTRGTEEVIQWLRGSKLAGNGDNPAYALPWYVVAGPTGSGKTSLLLSSGLDFHVLPGQRASEQQLVRPTRFCDWRVADSAVWLDTSGRYVAEGPDADEWAALFETVKRHRRARPVDGFLLAVNAGDVMGASDHENERQAKVLRARLDEAMARAGVRFPVYLVFTHMDALEGFKEFFGPFDGGEREQVWGFTFPLAQAGDPAARFDDEFNHLYGRLVRRRTVQLGAVPGPDRQLRVFKLPGRFRRARARMGAFAAALFRPNPFSENPLLRGVYFTSSRGEGAPGGGRVAEPFFTRSFFSEVVLPDRNIVAAEQARKGSPNLRRNLLLGAAGALVLCFVAGVVASYLNNKEFVAEANERGRKLTEVRRETSTGSGARVGEELAAVEDVRLVLADLDEYERTSPPLFMRFGLYAGGRLNHASADPNRGSILRHLYFEAIEELFLKRAVAAVEDDLRKFASAPAQSPAAAEEEDYLGRHYDLLKVYLMLSKPDKVEPTFLAQVLRDYWVKASLAGGDETVIRQLEYFASQAGAEDAPHPEVDSALVERARERLLAYPVVNRVYKRMASDISAAVNKPVKLVTITGAREGNVIQNTYTVPGAYTLEGYREMTERLKESAADEFRKDDWVMRADAGQLDNIDLKRDELSNLYQRDYKAHWQRFLQETRLREFEKKEEAVRSLRLLAGSTSPLEALLREAARQTKLSASGGGWWSWFRGLFASRAGAGSTTEVEREFAPLIQFFAGKDEKSPAAEYRTHLKKVADRLNSQGKPLAELSNLMLSGDDVIGLVAARKAVDDSLETNRFNSASPAAEAAARVLRLPLDTLNTMLVGADFEQIEKTWQGIQKTAQGFEQGFPFGEGPEVSMPKLAQFLNPQDGELTNFVRGPLKPYFEPDWSVKKEAADKFAPDFVAYIAAARRLQDALFPDKGKVPNVEYQLAIVPLAGGSARVQIDGAAPLSTVDKTTANLAWPGDKSGVRVTYAPDEGQEVAAESPGEWGLIKFFRASGGGEGKTPPFTLQPAGTPVRLTLQPKSGDPFRRELFTALRAPKSASRK
ncbi:MAG: type VI secretion system membrane subunit TssM [Pyrinomonadaceae bacterium]